MEDFHLSPDGATVWFSSTSRGTVNLYRVPLAGGEPTLALQGGAVGGFDPAGGFVVAARSSLTSPAELVRVDTAGTERQLTAMNAGWLAQTELPTPSSRMVVGAGGDSVQYWLLLPPGLDPARRYPVVFLIHGGPQGDWADAWSSRWNPALWAAQGWIVAAPNPRGSTGFGQRFVDEVSQDWCGKAMIDLDAVFDTVAALPNADTARMGIAGASYGGFAVDWLIGHTNRFKAAVSHDGVFNLESMSFATEELWFPEWEYRRPAVVRTCAQELRALLAAPLRRPDPDADPGDHQPAGLPGPGGPGAAALHRPASERGGVGGTGVRERRPLGARRSGQPAVARGGVRMDEEVSHGAGAVRVAPQRPSSRRNAPMAP